MSPLTRATEPGQGPGPWFTAGYGGGCSCCGARYDEGDQIRADGYGSWEGRCCEGDRDDPFAGTDQPFTGTSDEEMGF